MSISTRKNKTGEVFEARYRDTEGKSHRVTLGSREEGWDKRKAKAAERDLLAGLKQGSNPSFETVAWDWFNARLPNWRPRTEAAYKRSINRLKPFWEMGVRDVRPKHVAEWIPTHPYSPKTTNDDISVLHQIFDYAIRLELCETNPASSAPRPKVRRRRWRILTPSEIQAVDKAFMEIDFLDMNGRWDEHVARRQAQLMFRVLTRTGIRRDELRRLRVGDIDFDECVIRIQESKTEEGERCIAIPKSLSDELREWCKR
jgi:integrase